MNTPRSMEGIRFLIWSYARITIRARRSETHTLGTRVQACPGVTKGTFFYPKHRHVATRFCNPCKLTTFQLNGWHLDGWKLN